MIVTFFIQLSFAFVPALCFLSFFHTSSKLAHIPSQASTKTQHWCTQLLSHKQNPANNNIHLCNPQISYTYLYDVSFSSYKSDVSISSYRLIKQVIKPYTNIKIYEKQFNTRSFKSVNMVEKSSSFMHTLMPSGGVSSRFFNSFASCFTTLGGRFSFVACHSKKRLIW